MKTEMFNKFLVENVNYDVKLQKLNRISPMEFHIHTPVYTHTHRTHTQVSSVEEGRPDFSVYSIVPNIRHSKKDTLHRLRNSVKDTHDYLKATR